MALTPFGWVDEPHTKRQKHKKEVLRLLRRKQNVMLIGPGGIGKTTMLSLFSTPVKILLDLRS